MRKNQRSRINLSRAFYQVLLVMMIISLGLFGGSVPPSGAWMSSLPLDSLLQRVNTVLAAPAGEWTQEGHDAQHSGFTLEEVPQPWSLAWMWNGPDGNGGTGGHFYDAPADAHTVTGGNFVYAPAGQSGLFALDKNSGTPAWQVTSAAFNATPAYDPASGSLLAGSSNGKLYRIDGSTGQILGSYTAGSGINKAVLLVGSSAFITTDNGELHKVDTGSMSLAWKYAAGAAVATPAAYSAKTGLLVYATEDLYVHAVREADGGAQWRVKPTSHAAEPPFTFSGFWPVIAEQHGVVFLRLNLGIGGLWSGNQNGSNGGGVYPSSNAGTRDLLLANNGALENLFALDLSSGNKKFIPAVGYGGTELRTGPGNEGLMLVAPPVPVVKVNSDGSEVAYIAFRSGQGGVPDGRWDSHMGEMVLDNSTIPVLAAGDLRFVDFPNGYANITDEQTPFTMAGNTIFHAHWGASDGITITDRSSGKGLSHDDPIAARSIPAVIRRMQSCEDFNPASHQTSCGMSLYGDGRYWAGPGFWTYWNTYDPPTQASGAYSDGVKPRYTYASSGLIIVEGNGGELLALRSAGSAPAPAPTSAPSQPAPTGIPSQDGNWVFCANEDETCSFSGTTQVRYGANDKYTYQTATDRIACTNSVFGDPIPYSAKTCSYWQPGASPTATRLPTNAATATRLPTNAATATRLPTNAPTATRLPTNAPTATRLPTNAPTSLPDPSGSGLTLDSVEEFSQSCAVFSKTHASDRSGGVVELGAKVVDPFNSASINTTIWKAATISGGSYTPSIGSGVLNLSPNGSVRTKTTFTRSNLEVTAQFEKAAGQVLGFVGSLTTNDQYFFFSTLNGDGKLYAVVNNKGAEQSAELGALPEGMHRYRIEWVAESSTTNAVNFYIDGMQRAHFTVSSAGAANWSMYLANKGSSGALHVENAQASPLYVTSGQYTSCILDAGEGQTWRQVSYELQKASSSSISLRTRTSADGKTWRAWYALKTTSEAISSPDRYIQFRITLSTTNTRNSSSLRRITLTGTEPVSPTAAPTSTPTKAPTAAPTTLPSRTPTSGPTTAPTRTATRAATNPPALTATSTATPSQSGSWTFCANEGQTCAFTGSAQVRYGANGSYNYLTASDGIACTNEVFGDPLPYTAKSCAYQQTGGLPTSTSAPIQPGQTRTPAPTLPPAAGRISNLKVISGSPAVYEKFEVQFSVQSPATMLDLPYDPNPPAGVQPGAGISVNGLFSNDNWKTTITQPAFVYQPYVSSVIDNHDHLTPASAPVWAVRFAPQQAGSWQYRLSVQDIQGQVTYPAASQPALSFTASASSSNPYTRKGFVGVSPTDRRYFQFSDGTPFIGLGFNDGFSGSVSTNVEQKMAAYEQNRMNFMRVWMSGSGINGSQWPAWANNFLPMDAYLPGVSFDSANTYNGGLVSLRLDDANPCVYADFWRGGVPVEPNTTYTFTARVKTSNVTGPAASGGYGFVAKQGGWLDKECANSGTGKRIAGPVNGSKDWTVITGTYTSGASEKWMGGLYLARENASGGQVYIDEVHLYRSDDPDKVDLLRQPYANPTEHFDTMSASQWDLYIQSAEKHGVYLKLVIDEKNEWIRNRIGADGELSATADNNNFYAAPGTKVRWLEQAWWRYLIARWGYSTAIHSFEYVNEGDPYNGNHYDAAGAMATYFKQNDPSKHMVTTSFWHSFPNSEFWSNPKYADIAYSDIHAYISTGWGADASFIPDSMKESNTANVHSGKGSARMAGSTQIKQSILPRGTVIQGQGEWVIQYWMKASNLSATCGYNSTGSQMRVRWMIDGGNYGGGKEGVVPANSEAKDFICTSPAGTFDWKQFSSLTDRDGNSLPATARIIIADNSPHTIDLILENYGGTGGTAWIDDVQLINPSGKVQPVVGTFETTLLKEDTAWSNIAYGQVFGGGSLIGAPKPLVRGETGLDDGTTYDPDQLKDAKGIWLHNNVWAQMNAGGMYDLFWWASETIPQSIYYNYLTYQNFMAGIPLSNGRYRDSQAAASHPDLRVVGQRDDTAGQMHLWIQNTQHSWRRAVNGPAISGMTGTITIPNVASGSYRVEWWNTYATSSPVFKTETVSASSSLVLTLPSALADDVAVKITKN